MKFITADVCTKQDSTKANHHISIFQMVISNLNSNVIRTLYVTIPKICSLILTDLAVDGLEMVIIDGRVDVAFTAEVVEGVIHLLLTHFAIQLLCNLKHM